MLVPLAHCDLTEGGPVFSTADELADEVSKVIELPESAIPYLKKNSVALEIGKELNIPFDMSNARFIVIGEAHSVRDSFDLKLDFMKYFNRNYGIRYYLIESGVSIAHDINAYLQSGDESFIEYFKTSWRDCGYFGLKEHYSFMRKLYEYNMTVPKDQQIVLIPIDATGSWDEKAIKILRSYLPGDIPAPDSIAAIINELSDTTLQRYSLTDYLDLYERIEKSTSSYSSDFESYLGQDYWDFWYTLRVIIRTCRVQGSTADGDRRFNLRDKAAHESVCDLLRIYPQEKFMSQYGSEHIFQKKRAIGNPNLSTWLERLKNNTKIDHGEIITIYPLYCDCKFTIDEEDKPGMPDFIMDMFDLTNEDPRIRHRFEQVADQKGARHILFSLVEDDSPFQKKCYAVKNATGGVTTDYFQYVLLIKGSAAAQWW